jgi:hypothetical protein
MLKGKNYHFEKQKLIMLRGTKNYFEDNSHNEDSLENVWRSGQSIRLRNMYIHRRYGIENCARKKMFSRENKTTLLCQLTT